MPVGCTTLHCLTSQVATSFIWLSRSTIRHIAPACLGIMAAQYPVSPTKASAPIPSAISSACLRLAVDMTTWNLPRGCQSAEFEYCLTLLPANERVSVTRFLRDEDKIRAMLRYVHQSSLLNSPYISQKTVHIYFAPLNQTSHLSS